MIYSQQLQTPTLGRSVYFIDEVARLLGTSQRTIARRLRARAWTGPAPLDGIDKKLRWRRSEIDRWLASTAGR